MRKKMTDSPLHITINVDAESVTKALTRLSDGLKSPAFTKAIGEQVVGFSVDRILSRRNTAPDGSRWPCLAEATIARKKKKGLGHQGTLMESGDLWSKLQPTNPTKDSVEISSPMAYMLVHQMGGKAGKGRKTTIPARPFIGVSRDEEDALRDFVADWVKGLIEGGRV
jgi:phage virion morphogenesis protein